MPLLNSSITATLNACGVKPVSPCDDKLVSVSPGNYGIAYEVVVPNTPYRLIATTTDGTVVDTRSFSSSGPTGDVISSFDLPGIGDYLWYIEGYDTAGDTTWTSNVCAFSVVEAGPQFCMSPDGESLVVGRTYNWFATDLYDTTSLPIITPPTSDAFVTWSIDGSGNLVAAALQAGERTYTYTATFQDGSNVRCTFTVTVLSSDSSQCNESCATTTWDSGASGEVSVQSGQAGQIVWADEPDGPGVWTAVDGNWGWSNEGAEGFVGVASRDYSFVSTSPATAGAILCCNTARVLVLPPEDGALEHCAVLIEASLCGDTWYRVGEVTTISYSSSRPVDTYRDHLTNTLLADSAGFSEHSMNLSFRYQPQSISQTILAADKLHLRLWTVPDNDPSSIRPMLSAKVVPSNFTWSRSGSGKKFHEGSLSLTADGAINSFSAWS